MSWICISDLYSYCVIIVLNNVHTYLVSSPDLQQVPSWGAVATGQSAGGRDDAGLRVDDKVGPVTALH